MYTIVVALVAAWGGAFVGVFCAALCTAAGKESPPPPERTVSDLEQMF